MRRPDGCRLHTTPLFDWSSSSSSDLLNISKFLRKITKRSYINEQVLNRIPDNLDNCRELLKFGLKGNDLPALVELANEKPEDLGFIFGEDGEGENEDDEDGEYRGFDPDEKIEFDRKKLEKRNSKYLEKIDFTKLNQAQESFY